MLGRCHFTPDRRAQLPTLLNQHTHSIHTHTTHTQQAASCGAHLKPPHNPLAAELTSMCRRRVVLISPSAAAVKARACVCV